MAIRRAMWSACSGVVCLAVILIHHACAEQPPRRQLAGEGQRPWNVLLLTLDTTRADYLGCYGRGQARTPVIDGLADEGFLFQTNTSSNPVTQAAHATILTGVYPMVHGVRDNTFFRLPEERQTLAEILGAAGYATGAAIGGFPLTREFGTAQGFEHYDDDLRANRLDQRGRPARRQFATWYDERPAGHVNDAILPWLREQRDRPFFAWLHYWDPHQPHIAPAPYGQLFAHSPYDGEIAYADACLGSVLAELERTGEYERTLIVVTADHGEGLYEHGEATHAYLAYDSTIRVPLIVRIPGAEGGKSISERTGTVDIVPTILDLVGVEAPPKVQGRSLRRLMLESDGGEPLRPYYAESLSPRLSHGYGELRVLMSGSLKYIHGPRSELFDLRDDPGELRDLAHEEAETSREMEAGLLDFIRAHASEDAAEATLEINDETRRALEALGYLSTGGDEHKSVQEVLRSDGAAPQDEVAGINLTFRLRRALGSNEWSRARATAEKILERSPQNPYVRGSLAVALAGLGELDEAARVIEQTETHSGANQRAFLLVARKLFDADRRAQALALARRLASNHDTVDGWIVLARMLRESGDAAGFETALESARALNEDHPDVVLEAAHHHLESGELDLARRELSRLLEAHPLDLQAQLEAVRLTYRQGRGADSSARLQRLLRLAPAYCDALLEGVSMAVHMKQPAEAAEAMTQLQERCRDERVVERGEQLLEGLR